MIWKNEASPRLFKLSKLFHAAHLTETCRFFVEVLQKTNIVCCKLFLLCLKLSFSAHICKVEGISTTQNAEIERFVKRFCQLRMSVVSESVQYSDREIFYHQIIANMPQQVIEIVRCLKTYDVRTLGFLKKIRFFWEKLDFFFKTGKGGKFAVEYVSNDISS